MNPTPTPKKRGALFYVAMVIAALFVLNFLKGLFQTDTPSPAATVTQPVAPAPAPAPSTPAMKQVFDVRSLLFASAAQVKRQLGKPATEDHLTALQRKMGFPIEMEFVKDTTTLTVTYSSKTNKVTGLNLSFPHHVSNPAAFLQAGGLDAAQSARYTTKLYPVIVSPNLYASMDIKPIH